MPWRENKITLVPVLLSSSAFALSLLSVAWCEYISFTEQSTGFKAMYGIWYYTDTYATQSPLTGADQIVSGCISNPGNIPVDAKWKTAMSFSIICPIIGGIACVWVWFSQCWYGRGGMWKCLGITFLWCSLFSGLTLLFLGSSACTDNPILELQMSTISDVAGGAVFNETCDMHWGAKCNIAATILWFLAGVSMFKIDPPTRPPRPPPETQTVTYTKTTQADGAQVVTKNVVKGVAVAKELEEP